MFPLPQTLLLKIGLSLATLFAVISVTWFAAASHYSGKFVALRAQYEQAAKDAQKAADDKVLHDNYVSKEVNDEALQKLAGMSSTIDDLSSRLRQHPTIITTSDPSTCQAANGTPATVGSATPGSPNPAQGSSSTTSTLDTKALSDILDLGIDAINAELLWREWAKGVTSK